MRDSVGDPRAAPWKMASSTRTGASATMAAADGAAAGEATGELAGKKSPGRVSATHPPIFRAKPEESYLEWKRSVEVWIGGKGSQLPVELIRLPPARCSS